MSAYLENYTIKVWCEVYATPCERNFYLRCLHFDGRSYCQIEGCDEEHGSPVCEHCKNRIAELFAEDPNRDRSQLFYV